MEAKFYYYRVINQLTRTTSCGEIKKIGHPERSPAIAVCLIYANGDVGRGLAVCSLTDNISKRAGRMFALDRAVTALRRKAGSDPVNRDDALLVLSSTDFFLQHTQWPILKSDYNPPMTNFEQRILGRSL